MQRAVLVAVLAFLSCSPVHAQQPNSTEAPLSYLRGPAFPTLKHGPAWPKSYQPGAPVEQTSAPAITGTIQPGTYVPEPSAPKHYTRRSKHHWHRDSHGHRRLAQNRGTDTDTDIGTGTGRQVRIHASVCRPNSGPPPPAVTLRLHNRIFEHKTPVPPWERRTTGAAYGLMWKRG